MTIKPRPKVNSEGMRNVKWSGKSLFCSESLKEKILESHSFQRDEYCKMWLKKRDLSLMMEDLIFSSNYEEALPGFEQR